MKPEATAGLLGLRVERAFEPDRLAKDLQARVYEQVVPVLARSVLAKVEPDASNERVPAKGVAA